VYPSFPYFFTVILSFSLKSLPRLSSLLFLGVLSLCDATAQSSSFAFAHLRLNGLPFTATKEQIQQQFGKPSQVVEPHYECGFLSSAEQQESFYTLRYPQVAFTGNRKHGYLLESVTFQANSPWRLTYQKKPLTANTSLADFLHLMGPAAKSQRAADGTSTVFLRAGDDGATFTFKAGHLIKFTYRSPC